MSTEKSVRSRLLRPSTSASTSSAMSSSRSSWTSTSASRSRSRRLAQQVVEVVGGQRGDDQQDRVGADGRGLVELVGVDDEVLAQDRQVGGGERLPEVVERPAEVERLGEDRQRGRAAALVGLDDLRDGRALADQPGRRRAALVLGDQRHAGPRQRLLERALLRALVERALELGQRDALTAASDLVARVVDDAIEDVHRMIGSSAAALLGPGSWMPGGARRRGIAAAPQAPSSGADPAPRAARGVVGVGEPVIQATVWRSGRSARRARRRRRRSRRPPRPPRRLPAGYPPARRRRSRRRR